MLFFFRLLFPFSLSYASLKMLCNFLFQSFYAVFGFMFSWIFIIHSFSWLTIFTSPLPFTLPILCFNYQLSAMSMFVETQLSQVPSLLPSSLGIGSISLPSFWTVFLLFSTPFFMFPEIRTDSDFTSTFQPHSLVLLSWCSSDTRLLRSFAPFLVSTS